MPFTDFKSAVNSIDSDTLPIIFYECGGKKLSELDLSYKKIAVFIGSEGGFEKEEVDYALSKRCYRCASGRTHFKMRNGTCCGTCRIDEFNRKPIRILLKLLILIKST